MSTFHQHTDETVNPKPKFIYKKRKQKTPQKIFHQKVEGKKIVEEKKI